MKSFPQILKVFLIFSLLILISSASFAQNSGVDYERQVATATGIGAPNPNMPAAVQRPSALRAAKADAYRNLLEVIKGVRLNSETTVENFMVQSDYIHTQVEGVLQGFTVVDQQYMSDGTVEVTVEIPLTGDLAEVLLPPEKFGGGETVGMPTEPAPSQGNVFSGLIIDARGLGVQPAMAPKVLNESGSEVYGTGFVSREYAVQMGVVGYTKSLDQAKTDERTGDNPFVVKATSVEGPNKTDVVIADKDAGVIHGMAENLNFLEQAKVIVVID
jgi:hypothetical protein